MKEHVKFEIAKLLKEKGFDLPVHRYYQFIRDLSSKQDKTWLLVNSSFLVRESDAAMFPDESKNGVEVSAYSDRIYKDFNFKNSEDFISAPTIAEVIMWLYEKHGIWIAVVRFKDHASDNNEKPTFRHNFLFREYNLPTEAYEAAIEYTLNNLL